MAADRPASARLGGRYGRTVSGLLHHHLGHDPALEESGLPALEEAVAMFLANEGRRDFLDNMCDRIAAFGAAGSDSAAVLARVKLVRDAI